jgi:diguanylate cyclase (GGDEF)-like protein
MRVKITLLVVSIVAFASYAFGRFAFSGIESLVVRGTGMGAETAAEVLAEDIDPDWIKSVDVPAALDTKVYKELQERIGAPLRRGLVSVIHVVRLDRTHGQVMYLMSLPNNPNFQDYVAPGTVESLIELPMPLEQEYGHQSVLLDTPGYYMAGWAPVKEHGEVVGLVILATDITDMIAQLQTLSWLITVALVVLVLLSGLLAFRFGTTFEKVAVTDGLMGIYNHKFFKQRLEQEVAKSARYAQQTSLVLLDIDFFKRVNDTYGHATGDIVLKTLAKIVSETCRNTDVVARYGGEEIAVILTHTGVAGAQEFAERLRLKISHHVIRDPEEHAEFRVTVSIGVAQWEKGVHMLDMIKRADAALYHSKHTGRNRVTIYQDDILPAPENPQPKTTER